jgi:hypothetical protein
MAYFWQDIIKDTPICKSLIDNYPQIKEEVLKFTSNENGLFNYPKYSVDNKPLYEHYWKAVPFSTFEGEFISIYATPEEKHFIKNVVRNSRSNCPSLDKILTSLEKEGHIANCFASRLIPGSIINPHRGWTSDYMRIHLGLTCDPECKITVGEETKTWEEGKIIAFKDGGSYPHSVVHNGTKERIVLSIDVKISYLQQFVDLEE